MSFLRGNASIFRVPGIGRRTGSLLYRSGVKTVAHFVALPDLLLENTFGPSLPTVRRRAQSLLAPRHHRQHTAIFQSLAGLLVTWLLVDRR